MLLPKLSVITVVRNAPEDLNKTLQSVLAQTYPSIEYIVRDGASTDDTLSVAEGYRDAIDVLVSEPDEGIYDAMNRAVADATGEWVIFMNAGDVFYSEDSLLDLSDALCSKSDVILAGVEQVLVDDLETRRFADLPKPQEQIWKQMPACHQAVLVRRALQSSYGFDTSYQWCADHDLLIRLYADQKCFRAVDTLICIYDCAGGRARDPILYIKERWRLSRKLATLPQRLCFFGREWFHCRIWGTFVGVIKQIIPDRWLVRLRRLRGTAGNSGK
jgi:glycosyltransferase involved in cell wall biosynthesis